MIEITNDEVWAAMKDLGIDRLPIQRHLFDLDAVISNPFTVCMSAIEKAIDDVLIAHSSWKSQVAANAALLELCDEDV